MVVYALFAAVAYEQTDLLGLYASRAEAVAAATEFLRSDLGKDWCLPPACGYRLYVETRIVGESPEPGGPRGFLPLTWLSVDPTAEGAPAATIDE